MKKTNEVSAEQLATLNDNFPVVGDTSRVSYPRFGMLSKDIVETSGTGKNKKVKVVQAAGTFFTEKDEGEVNPETGKKVWTKSFIEGESVNVIIVFHRRQLRMFDASLEKFYSTPIFDNAEQVIPLFLDKKVMATGTQAFLQGKFPALTQKGKPTSSLKEETILYVIYEGEMYQCTLTQSSKWEFKTYTRTCNPSGVVTSLSSVEETFGENTYNKIKFTNKRVVNVEEFDQVSENQQTLVNEVEKDEKILLQSGETAEDRLNKEFSDKK